MPNFDFTVQPPAAVFDLEIAASNLSPARVTVPMLVDSGATHTFVPVNYIRALEASIGAPLPYSSGRVIDLFGRTFQVRTVYVDLSYPTAFTINDVRVIAAGNRSFGLLGRDILQNHRVLLNYPLDWWEIA